VKGTSVNPFDAQSVEGRFDTYFAEYGVDKEVQSGLEFSGVIESDGQKFNHSEKVFGYVNMITGWKSHAECQQRSKTEPLHQLKSEPLSITFLD